jgi:hypothetical protein
MRLSAIRRFAHYAGQTIAQPPEHLVADVGLQTIHRKDDAALGFRDGFPED